MTKPSLNGLSFIEPGQVRPRHINPGPPVTARLGQKSNGSRINPKRPGSSGMTTGSIYEMAVPRPAFLRETTLRKKQKNPKESFTLERIYIKFETILSSFYVLRVWEIRSYVRFKAYRRNPDGMRFRSDTKPLRASVNETGFSQNLSANYFENLTIYKIPLYLLWGESGVSAGHTWSIQPCSSQGVGIVRGTERDRI